MTHKLNKTEYPSPYIYDPQANIQNLVNKEAYEIETVTDVQGTAGRILPAECEVIF